MGNIIEHHQHHWISRSRSSIIRSFVVLHGHVLAADDRIAGEPVAIVLLRCIGRRIDPFDGDTIGRGVGTRERLDGHPQRGLKKRRKEISKMKKMKEKRKIELTVSLASRHPLAGSISMRSGPTVLLRWKPMRRTPLFVNLTRTLRNSSNGALYHNLSNGTVLMSPGVVIFRWAKLRFERRSDDIDCTMRELGRQNDWFHRRAHECELLLYTFFFLSAHWL